MTDVTAAPLLHTELHSWHESHQAKLVDFEGWEMPVSYDAGTIAEHLATRRSAGLFDVSHMGRFRITGDRAVAHLEYVLTNDPRGLDVGQAHYTFIATEQGGAVDDAYLYRVGDDDYLLVVNAANRSKDWEWLNQHNKPGATMEDVSDDLAMVSLQGPLATTVLLEALGEIELPDHKRNRLISTDASGRRLIIARTGYTGEPIGFELFPHREDAVEMWERLVAAGAVPAGLGARDSLRLEAGFPLYGHELGEDRDGVEIPIFANSLAAWAVRAEASSPFIGQPDLARQREEFTLIKRHELSTPVSVRRLTRLVQPLAVFEGRKPLRAGNSVMLDGEPVGYVTSGTSVPYATFDGDGIDGAPTDEHGVRPIALALLRSDIHYRTDRRVVLQVADDRGRVSNAELAERNVWSAAPYARPYPGFEATDPARALEPDALPEAAARLGADSAANTRWRREECVNLIPSEQPTSEFVDRLCRADPAGRYNEHNHVKALGPNAGDVRYYQGTGFITEK
ncbi:MAG: glycine cleavage system aminomethyltransferase GcvT, partial [Acidimicrobiia bacterium]